MTTMRDAARRKWTMLAGLAVAMLAALGAVNAARSAEEASMEDYLLMQKDAEPFKAFGDRVIAMAAKGDASALAKMFSPTIVQANGGQANLQTFVEKQIVPYFVGYASTEQDTTITPTQLPHGPSGFALYKKIRDKDGQSKPLVLYVLREGGTLVVGNVILGKTYRDMHPES